MATKQPQKTSASKLSDEQKAADNTALDAAPLSQAKREQREGVSLDQLVEVAPRHVSKAAVNAKAVKSVGLGVTVAPGADVTLQIGDRSVAGRVYQVHPGRAADEASGITAVEPTVDVKAFTGNPDTGGHEMLTGIPVSQVSQTVNL